MSLGVAELWFWALVAAVVGYRLCRAKPWLALFIVPFTVVVPLVVAMLERVSDIGVPARGSVHVVVATLLILVADAVGLYRGGFKYVRFSLYERDFEPKSRDSDRGGE